MEPIISQTITKKVISVNYFPDEESYNQSIKSPNDLNLIPASSGGAGSLANTVTFSITNDISENGSLTLPVEYTVSNGSKDFLGLVYEGVALIRNVDYVEVGQPNSTSTTVNLLFNANANDNFIETTLKEY